MREPLKTPGFYKNDASKFLSSRLAFLGLFARIAFPGAALLQRK